MSQQNPWGRTAKCRRSNREERCPSKGGACSPDHSTPPKVWGLLSGTYWRGWPVGPSVQLQEDRGCGGHLRF